MDKVNNFIVQRPGIQPKPTTSANQTAGASSTVNFQDVLNQKINQTAELKISKHAEFRMKSRNINLSQEQMDRVNKAVEKASQKGVKDSLVLVDDVALVVSVRNKTIITAVDSKELKENVFTNIDGAVIT